MSRHTFPGREPGITVAIGWDRPLATYFVQVLSTDAEGEDRTIVWQGTSPGELGSGGQAVTLARAWADLPADLAARLETDRLQTLHRSDGEAQIAARRFIGH